MMNSLDRKRTKREEPVCHTLIELAPKLLKIPNVKYLLSGVFSQDPLEIFLQAATCEKATRTPQQVPLNAMMLIQ